MLYPQRKYEEILEIYSDLKEQDSDMFHLINDFNRFDAEEIIHRGSLLQRTKFLGEEHPETLRSKRKLASWLDSKCRRTEAETLYRDLVTLRMKVQGKDHKDTFEDMNDLASVLGEQAKYHDAEKVLRDLVSLQEVSLGKEHHEVLKTTGALARVLLNSGRLGAAEETLRQLVALKSQLHGEEHPETIESLDELAIVVSEQQNYAEAERFFRQLTQFRLQSLGRDNPEVLTTLSYVAVMLQKQGNHDEAEHVLYKQHTSTKESTKNEDPEMFRGGSNSFAYQPLTLPNSTRILKIYPSRYKTAALVCELTEEVLNSSNPPSYAAISYTWGSQAPSRRIFCHGKTLLVTENCEAILRQFRRTDKISYLWIDAICINQNVVQERNDQVAMMEDIYRLAEVVAVWLGAATDFTDEAFDYFKSLAENQYNLDSDTEKLVLLSKEILEQPWFTRMWTIQEVAMASPKVVYLCRGDKMMRWETFMQAMASRKLDPGVSYLANSAAQIFNRLRPLFESARESSRRPGVVSPQMLLNSFTPLREILNIIVEVRGKLATDVRDKVFALHGIFKAFDARFPAPDYSKSARQVFCETAKAIIEQDESLHILYHVSSKYRMPDLPSWVPDWGDTDVVDGNPVFSFWGATRDSVHRVHFEPGNGNTLPTAGKVIGKITTRATALSVGSDQNDCDVAVFQDWMRCCQNINGIYFTGEPTDEVFYKTLVQLPTTERLDVFISESYREKVRHESYEEWAKVIKRGMESSATFQTPGIAQAGASELTTSGTSATALLNGAAGVFHDTIREMLSGKSLFLTDDTQYIGIAGDAIRKEDVVALLSGLEMPIILRPTENGYKVVTWAYVHGVMEGEMWPGMDHLDIILLT
ncbi:heterokaryon incompatibility protein-domain-containing protein [Xylaria arbuscula]|nr:heterokaryon incompatibility protein-domain-containing protein [Xylaria arbuscula]